MLIDHSQADFMGSYSSEGMLCTQLVCSVSWFLFLATLSLIFPQFISQIDY